MTADDVVSFRLAGLAVALIAESPWYAENTAQWDAVLAESVCMRKGRGYTWWIRTCPRPTAASLVEYLQAATDELRKVPAAERGDPANNQVAMIRGAWQRIEDALG